jgi:hypothetical protein
MVLTARGALSVPNRSEATVLNLVIWIDAITSSRFAPVLNLAIWIDAITSSRFAPVLTEHLTLLFKLTKLHSKTRVL